VRTDGLSRRYRSRVRCVLAAVLVLSLAAPLGARAESTATVEMRDDAFSPTLVRIDPGGAVTWVNRGRNPHNVLADDASWTSPILQLGDSYTQRFPKEGVFPFYCSLHGSAGAGMIGVVIVGVAIDRYERGNLGSLGSHTRSLPSTPPQRPAGGKTIRVPADAPTIQAAVDRAAPGDLVRIASGVYHEAVRVTTPHLTLRGEDRNAVILDGSFELMNGIAVFGADGVVIENMTARHYQLNGFYWRSVWGYRGSYLTAYGNGDYGVYAFDSGVGQFDHSYAAGHPDSGFYIGQCDPCHALVTNVISRHNAVGFSGTNASGDLVIEDSEWSGNMAGIVPNTLDAEALAPQHGVTIRGNVVRANHDRTAPAKRRLYALFGYGIVLLGGNANEVYDNSVSDHANAGIVVAPSIDEHLWMGGGNHVFRNTVSASGQADLALIAPVAGGNCFEANIAATTLPPLLGSSCGSPFAAIGGGDVALLLAGLGRLVRSLGGDMNDWRTEAEPETQPNMPNVGAAPAAAGPLDADTPESDSVSPPAPTALFGNALALAYGYAIPLAFVAALALVIVGRLRRRWLLLLPGTYVAIGIAIFVSAYLF
jgi:plastocyanin